MNDWKQKIDAYEQAIIDAVAAMNAVVARIPDQPGPQTTPVPAYLSGRWKLRDGTGYGR